MNDELLEELFAAYYDARKNKRNTINALKFELHYERNLFELYQELIERSYDISRSICFINFDPVQREIFAADFRDRIIHHLLFNWINPLFDRTFIVDSYSCRKNKGTHYGIKRIRRFISQCSSNYTKDCFIMKLDIEGYFMKMDRDILFDKIIKPINQKKAIIKDYELVKYLLTKIIYNDPTKNCIVRGKEKDWNGLPASKSLFCSEENKGLPIGNLTSQLFGNIYLNEFDHFVKNKLGIKYYGRYVDDMVMIHEDRNYLLECRGKINRYLKSNLELNLHPRKFYLQHYKKGVQFLGVFIKPYRIYIGKRCKTNFYKTINYWNKKLMMSKSVLPTKELKTFRANINSYLGLLVHYKTYYLRRQMLFKVLKKDYLKSYIDFDLSLTKIILKKDCNNFDKFLCRAEDL